MSGAPNWLAQLEPNFEGLRKAEPRSMTATRDHAADSLAVDVVGYSRLMGEDEARTARMGREWLWHISSVKY
jgi:hypothetical protein